MILDEIKKQIDDIKKEFSVLVNKSDDIYSFSVKSNLTFSYKQLLNDSSLISFGINYFSLLRDNILLPRYIAYASVEV